MDAQALLPHRTALIGAVVALTVGLGGGLILRTGSQTAPEPDIAFISEASYAQAAPIVWPKGAPPDYVIGTDFLKSQQLDQPPVVVASYEVPEYVPAAWTEPTPTPPVRPVEPSERTWASTGGDILDVRLPEDAPAAPEPPQAPEAPVALTAAY